MDRYNETKNVNSSFLILAKNKNQRCTRIFHASWYSPDNSHRNNAYVYANASHLRTKVNPITAALSY